METTKLALIIFGMLFQIASSNDCLISSLIKPCIFHKHGSRTHMMCTDIKDVSTLLRILNGIKGCPVFMLQFIRLELNSLPRGAFNGTSINSLIFTNCSLMNLAEDGPGPSPFLGLGEELHTFGVSGAKNPLFKWNWNELSKLYSLETLSLARSNNLSIIPRTFSQINGLSLRKLAITGSCMKDMENSAFANFHKLESINLEGNHLYLIRRDMFPVKAKNLHRLSLRDNLLSTFDSDVFSNMPALKTLYLEGNHIKYIQQSVFSHLWSQLNTLLLYRNPIVCDCKMAWILSKKVIYEVENVPFTCSNPSHMRGTIVKYLQRNVICT